jgi:HAE1 family hydrophobic/amphiphilic exporter-1
VKLVDVSIRYPVSVIVAVLLGGLFGVLSLLRLPIQMIPTIDRPEITVQTRYPGAGPLEVEEEVTDRQEELLNTVENLREMISTSREGESRIILKYDWGTNKDVARLDVSEKIAAVRDLPDDIEEPIIRAVNSDEQTPIGWIVLVTDGELNAVRPLAEDVIKAQFERVPGVGQVWFFGGEEREVHVEVDFAALAARGLSVPEVREALLRENRNIKAGGFDEGKRRFAVRTEGRYRALAEVEQTIVRRDAGGPIRVGDVARVSLAHEEPLFVVRQSGQPALIFGILRKTGSNTIEVMEGVRAVVDDMNARYRSSGIEVRTVYDATKYIEEAIALVRTNLLIGAFLATLVLIFFLRSKSAVLVLGLSIPISVVTTFVFIALFGRTLNIISMAGLTFATGMVLDNAIVVLENIFRHRELGKGSVRAARDGTVEVWGAILASTLTTLAVFLPIILVQEEAGQIFRDIAIAISIAVALSLVVAITVIPMLSARLLRTPPRSGDSRGGRMAHHLSEWLVGLLRWILASSARKLAVSGAILAGAILSIAMLVPAIDYLPEGNRNMIFVSLRTPPGYNLQQNERIIRMLEERILVPPEVYRMFAVVRHDSPVMGIVLKEAFKDKRSIRSFMDRLEELTEDVPAVRGIFIRQAPLIRRGRIGSGNLEVQIQGDDLGTIRRLSETLEARLDQVPGAKFVNPSFEVGKPEFVVEVDRVRAAELGLTVSEVGSLVETKVNGTVVGTYDDDGRELDLRLRGPEGSVASARDLEQTVLYTPNGQVVQLADLAEVEARVGPTQIEHTDMDRSVKLSVGMEDTIPLAEAVERLQQAVAPTRAGLPLGYTVEMTGQATDLERAWLAFRGAFLLAIFITYLLLASLFESFRIPLVIMVSVPFAVSGGVAALATMSSLDPTVKLDTITMLGFVILIGVVVNNAILLTHQALNRMDEGAAPQDALLDAVRSRVRPIFMTMTTTCVGMSPLVFAGGAGSELYRGLGSTLVGGLIFSTIFTLVLIPTLLSFVLSARTAKDEVFRTAGAGVGPR